MYLDKMVYGFLGVLIYGNPCTTAFTLYKEIYRLEVNTRNIESEKRTRFYNDLL